jgi:hypothetical protein
VILAFLFVRYQVLCMEMTCCAQLIGRLAEQSTGEDQWARFRGGG